MVQKIGCLVIHGFGGSYREIGPLAEVLKQQGIVTRCPVLSGHTGHLSDLKTVCYQDWISSAEQELVCLQKECEVVFIAGFSMGGLIGMQLAEKYPVQGLITINTPVYCLDRRKIFSNIVHDLTTGDYANIRRYLKPSNRMPLKALLNFRRLLRQTMKILPSLQLPLMIAQAIDDDVVHHRSAGYILSHAGSRIRQPFTYVRGGHVILLSDAVHAVVTDVLRFIHDHTPEYSTFKKAG